MKGIQGATVERIELAAKVRALRDEGLTQIEIGRRLGISRSYASELDRDPTGAQSRARKDSYVGECVECGAPTCGSDGPDNAPERCSDCEGARLHGERYWTPAQIIESFQRFHAETGRTPAASDSMGSSPSQRDHFSVERLAEIDSAPMLAQPWVVAREFGSWRAGIIAAGLTPRPTGAPGHRGGQRLSAAAQETLRLIASGDDTALRIGAARGVNPATAYAGLRGLLDKGLVRRRAHGVYELTSALTLDTKEKNVARQYVVLAKNGNGYSVLDTVEAVNTAHAIEKVATTEGSFIAVPAAHWNEETVAPVTRFAVVKETAVA